jgi:hypothetical protein
MSTGRSPSIWCREALPVTSRSATEVLTDRAAVVAEKKVRELNLTVKDWRQAVRRYEVWQEQTDGDDRYL